MQTVVMFLCFPPDYIYSFYFFVVEALLVEKKFYMPTVVRDLMFKSECSKPAGHSCSICLSKFSSLTLQAPVTTATDDFLKYFFSFINP